MGRSSEPKVAAAREPASAAATMEAALQPAAPERAAIERAAAGPDERQPVAATEVNVRSSSHLIDPAEPEFDEVGETQLDHLVAELLTSLGEDVTREGMVRTPQRVERSLRFLMSGYEASVDRVINDALFRAEASDMVVVKDIEFYSLCEHHMLPFFGKAHIAYIPAKSILGLSKFARVVDVFARRMQVQERMTSQIADALVEVLEPEGLAVVTEASHLCMMMRGVEKQGSTTRIASMRGVFKTDARTRQEFLDAIG